MSPNINHCFVFENGPEEENHHRVNDSEAVIECAR